MTDEARLRIGRAALLAVLPVLWQPAGTHVPDRWIGTPVAIAGRLADGARRDRHIPLGATPAEIAAGLAIGVPAGILTGVTPGRLSNVSAVLNPFVVMVMTALPVVALAPLPIMWLRIGMLPKIVLVAVVSFLLLVFDTFAGAGAVGDEQRDALIRMGASGPDRFPKVVLPGCTAPIMAGPRNVLPHALIAAVIGETMVRRAGLGHLVSRAGQQFDMTGIRAGLFVPMILGSMLDAAMSRTERRLLRWRRAEGARDADDGRDLVPE